jgi:hypothetical protein
MMKKTFKHDRHFWAHVTLEIEPNKEFDYTKVVAHVKGNDPMASYTWWLSVPYMEDIDEVFAEIKKDEYVNQGYSEC